MLKALNRRQNKDDICLVCGHSIKIDYSGDKPVARCEWCYSVSTYAEKGNALVFMTIEYGSRPIIKLKENKDEA